MMSMPTVLVSSVYITRVVFQMNKGITSKMAFKKGYGSEGICAHCMHNRYCAGSTIYVDPNGMIYHTGARYDCHGNTTWCSACSNGSDSLPMTIEHEVFEEG